MARRAHLDPQVRAYTKVGAWDIQVLVGAREDLGQSEPPSEHSYGWKPIWLRLAGKGATKPMYMHLTGMTLEELESLQQVITLALEDAKVISQDLDRQAYEVFAGGSQEVPLRALASAPPFFERSIELPYMKED